jgi:disulfide bond formation protein DsbB
MLKITFKKINLLGAFLSFLLISVAIFLQITYELEPCPLCITQRIIFIVTGIIFLFFAFLNSTKFIKLIHLLSLFITNTVGIIFSIRHIFIQNKWVTVPAECGIDLNYMFENFPLTEAFNLLFVGAGDCSEIDWTFLGITLPQLALIWYLFFIIFSIFIFRRVY